MIVSELPPATLQAMREWVADCAINAEDLENIESADDSDIIGWVARHYAGGLAGFVSAR